MYIPGVQDTDGSDDSLIFLIDLGRTCSFDKDLGRTCSFDKDFACRGQNLFTV